MKNFVLSFLLLSCISLNAQILNYQFNNVPIGGGGYITGMVIHPNNSDIQYFRTDIGGAYKWNAVEEKMEQIIQYGEEMANFYSVAGVALHPQNENEVFLAVDRRCKTDGTSAILHSIDYGENFNIISTSLYFAGNGGRNCTGGSDKDRQGNPIAINPNNTNELFIGTRDQGLWKLTIDAETFTPLSNGIIPTNTDRHSIRSVQFHPTLPHFVFIGYATFGIYMGETNLDQYWKIDNNLTDLTTVSDLSISIDGNHLFAACKKQGIYRCENPTSGMRVWEKVLDYTGIDEDGDGFLTVSCSPHDANSVVTVDGDYNALNTFRSSNDAGSQWTLHNGTATNIFPWRDGVFGSHISQLVFDPMLPNTLYYTSWFSTFKTNNYTVNDIQWNNEHASGHEETVTSDILPMKINSANRFLSHLGADDSGFIVDNIDAYPTETIRDILDDANWMVKGAAIAGCENDPDHLIACLTREWDNSTGDLAISTDGGQSFSRSTNYDDNLGKSCIAIASDDPNRVLIANKNGLQFSTDEGYNFTPSIASNTLVDQCNVGNFNCLGPTTVNDQAINFNVFSVSNPIASDKVLSCLFYYYDWQTGNFSISTDYGENWCIVSNGLPTYLDNQGVLDEWKHKNRVTTIPGYAKDVWVNFKTGLYHSIDGGVSWTIMANVQNALLFSFGKAITEGNYPALYLYGKANNDNIYGYYRSIDGGQTWEQLNESDELFGSPRLIAGDRELAGRLYIGTSGLGLIHADDLDINLATPADFTYDPTECCSYPLTVHETSGLVVNRYDSYWTHNDADNTNELFEMDEFCNVVRTVEVGNAHNYDWEDICKDDDGNFYIGEFGSKNGSNSPNGIYDDLFIYKIGNPDFHCDAVVTADPIPFTFPSSVKDCEAIFYWNDDLYLVSKNHSTDANDPLAGVAELYKVPAITNQPSVVASYLSSLTLHDYPALPINNFKVTAADLSPDGSILVLMGQARFWVITNFTPGIFFDGIVTTIDFNNSHQREGVAFADNHSIYVTDENKNLANANRGNFVKIDLCQFIPNHPTCDCTATFTTDKAATYQDAVEELADGSISNGSSDLELTYDNAANGNQKIGLRFSDLNLPNGAHINQAYIQFTVDETNNINPSNLTIWGEAIDDAPVFANVPLNISDRTKTGQSVSWSFVDWLTVGSAEREQRTADLAPIVQEIVNRSGWQTDSNMAFIIEGIGRRVAENRAGCQHWSPMLFIEYCEPSPEVCVSTLTISDPDILSATYRAGQATIADGQVQTGSNVQMKAGNCVELKEGFEVKIGAEFLGDIEDCID